MQGVIVEPVANMYSAPSLDADVVSQATYGTNVGLVEEKGGWLKIRTPDDYTGWVPASAVLCVTEGQPYAAAGRVAQVESLFAHLYRETDVTKHAPLLTVPFETRLEVMAEPEASERRWIQVRLPDAREAWIQRGDVSFNTQPLSIPTTIELAKRFLGAPYTWGGTSARGFDCSGYVQMLYRKRGIGIPRDTGPQFRWEGFVPVARNKLKPGDLIYFGRSETRISHAGMYIGKGKFIHATTHEHPVVQISKLKEEHWKKLYVGARRPK